MTPTYPTRQWVPIVFGDSVFHNTVTQIVSHPAEAATRTELYYFAPSTDNEAIDNAVDRLIEVGILQEIGDNDFVGLTEDGKQFVVDSRLYRGSDVLKAIYMRTELTEEVEASAELPRPNWYLDEITSPDFEEREAVRNGDAFAEGWDRILYETRLTVESTDGMTGLTATFERATETRHATDDPEYEVIVEQTYELSSEEQDAIESGETVHEVRESSEGVMNRSEGVSSYTIEFDAFMGEGTLFSPSYSVDVKRESGGTVISAYVEPNRDTE